MNKVEKQCFKITQSSPFSVRGWPFWLLVFSLGVAVIWSGQSYAGTKSRDYWRTEAERQINIMRNNPNADKFILSLNGAYVGNNPQYQKMMEILTHLDETDKESFVPYLDYEPSFPVIEFLKQDQPTTLSQRIESMSHGITMALPDRYDQYGYEIRRYMAAVGNDEVFQDPKRLVQEIANVQRAKYILELWSTDLTKEIWAIQKELDADVNAAASNRILFKFTSGKVRAFLVEVNGWLDHNEKFLRFLYDNYGTYSYQKPVLNFKEREVMEAFLRVLRAREKSLEVMYNYPAFRVMIY